MRYKILNRLFGWDFIQWKNSADQGIARVCTDYNGVCYYFRYKSTRLVDEITKASEVIWLTCRPEKYLKS